MPLIMECVIQRQKYKETERQRQRDRDRETEIEKYIDYFIFFLATTDIDTETLIQTETNI